MFRHPHRAALRRIPLFAAVAGALAVVLVAAAPAARAAEVTVPNVVGQTETAASDALKAVGFGVEAVDIAEGEVGRVHSQTPQAGTVVDAGASVQIRVGVATRIQTTAPEAVGRPLNQALAELSPAYVVEVENVTGPPEQSGLVLEQDPAPGQPLLFRGILRLRAVAGHVGEGGAIVPPLLGRTEPEAKAAVEGAGLVLVVKEVEDAVAAPGQIVSQDPPSGAEILPGGTVTVRIATATSAEPQGAPVPSVVGLSVADAEKALLLAGFVAQASFSQAPGQAPWTVYDQFPKGGEVGPVGSKVKVAVALPGTTPTQIPVPSVIGLSSADAQGVLTAAGLQAAIVVQPSNLQQGIAFLQSPPAGMLLPPGAVVQVTVAGPPPGNWTPPVVKVPNVIGLTSDAAYAKLVFAGLWPKAKKNIAPNAPLGIVDDQHPHAGANAFPGQQVSFYTPEASIVPNLMGKTRNQAISLLQQAGLNAAPQGPPSGLGSTKVVSQSQPPGVKIARGSTVAFAYQYTGGIPLPKVVVPNVIGLTKGQAQQALAAKNLVAQFQGPNIGFLQTTEVTAQNPGPGTLVLIGSNVLVVYKLAGAFPLKVQVPNVIGKTKAQAEQILTAKNLVPQMQGPFFGIGSTKVTSQTPLPGVFVAPGSAVVAVYVYTGGIQPIKVQVPNVVGLPFNTAKQVLAQKGFGIAIIGGLQFGKVKTQSPAGGTMAFPASTVKVTLKFP